MDDFHFRKSRYSGGQANQECVEVALNVPGTVAVRDSKRAGGPVVVVGEAAWAVFLGGGGLRAR
ncbi:DUF397 domain-containing protein [Streptomyces globosus]|uniref:DUF397 domain-containing protein n=1 Tax=Streptomyces globosus TaxID=68209 RepID=A0A344TTX6_9ACTN|nr:DUF397 domain-containing protein [Streptomyces globosus]AXE22097.1 DUF397 domain-containing protein [Streptomyces globosus]